MGISVKMLANQVGFEDRVIDQIENDPQFLEQYPIFFIIDLAQALGLSPFLLFGQQA
jgi:hypothetical protein